MSKQQVLQSVGDRSTLGRSTGKRKIFYALVFPLICILALMPMTASATPQPDVAASTNAQRCFAEVADSFVDVWQSSVAWADYDGDGDLDVVIAGTSDTDDIPVTRLYQNNGGSFTEISANLMNLRLGSADWADYDGDGDPDLLLTGADSDFTPQTKLYRNDDGTFVEVGTPFVGVRSGDADWADYDGDGDLDVVITGSNGGVSRITTLYRNEGSTFVDSGAMFYAVGESSVAWKDYNWDGNPDLFVMGQFDSDNNVASLYRNNGGGSFGSVDTILRPLQKGSASWADYDGNGYPDLFITGATAGLFSSDAQAVLYQNDGFNITSSGLEFQGVYDGNAVWADYDRDGDLDLFITGNTGNSDSGGVSILYRNEGGSPVTFSAQSGPDFPFVNLSDSYATWADYDGDGDPDLLLTGYYFTDDGIPTTRLYQNGPCGGSSNEINVADGDVQGLIDAINAANASSAPGMGRQASPAVINLATGGSYTLTAIDNSELGGNGLPVITGTVTINGNGATIARSSAEGTPDFRILRVRSGANLTLRDLTVTNGAAISGTTNSKFGGGINSFGALTLESTRILSNTAAIGGGGLMLGAGPVVISDTLIAGNRANTDENGGGGGLQAQAGTVTLTGVTIENNSAPDGGGLLTVVDNRSPLHLTINRSTIRNNTVMATDNPLEGTGGGIQLSLAQENNAGSNTVVAINDTLIDNNTAINGGGIGMGILQPTGPYTMQLTLNRSAVVNNQTQGTGMQQGNGGGILNLNAELHLVNSTISGNTATGNPQAQFSGVGGGIANGGTGLPTTVTMTNTSIISNTALAGGGILNALAVGTTGPVVSFANSLIGGNIALGGAPFGPSCLNQGGTLTSLGHNLDQNNTCGFTAAGDQTNVDPMVGPLADNGGPTPTHALMDNSPAIDAGDSALCPATDQRGEDRPVGEGCDIGAYEGGTKTVEYRIYLPLLTK